MLAWVSRAAEAHDANPAEALTARPRQHHPQDFLLRWAVVVAKFPRHAPKSKDDGQSRGQIARCTSYPGQGADSPHSSCSCPASRGGLEVTLLLTPLLWDGFEIPPQQEGRGPAAPEHQTIQLSGWVAASASSRHVVPPRSSRRLPRRRMAPLHTLCTSSSSSSCRRSSAEVGETTGRFRWCRLG